MKHNETLLKYNETLRRYLLFTAGLFVNSLGISLIIKADLGSSPISSLPYTFSLLYPVSLGTATFVLNMLLLTGKYALAPKEFRRRDWLQIPVSFLFGFFIDLSMAMLESVQPSLYAGQLTVLTAGCIILGLGVSMEVIADVVMLAGEAFVQTASRKTRKEFGLVKIGFDTSLMILACLCGLILGGKIIGVREGTLVAAVLVGFAARQFNRVLAPALVRYGLLEAGSSPEAL